MNSVFYMLKSSRMLNKCVIEITQSWASLCQFSGRGQVTLSNFPEILLKLSLSHMMNICKIWMKFVKKWHDYKAF